MIHRLILLGLACWLLAVAPAHAAQAVIALPQGREVLDMRWLDRDTLVLVEREAGELHISLVDAGGAERLEMELPRSLERAGGDPELFRLALSPLGNSLAVVERNASLLSASRLSAYRISREEISAVSTYRMPMEFWPDKLCWDEAGNNLFMSMRPYLQTKQKSSLGMFRMADSSFVALLEREKLDLVEQLAFLPGSGELAVLCSAYEGAYPRNPMLVLVNPAGNRTRVVHADASQGRLQLLDNGDLLLRTEAGRSSTWMMHAGDDSLQLLEGKGLPAWDCQVSRDGSWLAGMSGKGLLLQDADASTAYDSGIASALFRFNFDGSRLAVLEEGNAMLHLMEPGNIVLDD